MNCVQLVELVTDYFDGALSAADTVRFDQHINQCTACRNHLGQMRITVQLTGALIVDDISPEACESLLDALRTFGGRGG